MDGLFMDTYIHACIATQMHTYIHTYIHTYMQLVMDGLCVDAWDGKLRSLFIKKSMLQVHTHTYIHTYIHMYIQLGMFIY